jgi:hypothetical protein
MGENTKRGSREILADELPKGADVHPVFWVEEERAEEETLQRQP